jgi:diacylglycerol kinase
MEFIKFCAELFLYLSMGVYLYCVLVLALTMLNEGLERMVDGLGNKISKIRIAKSLRK